MLENDLLPHNLLKLFYFISIWIQLRSQTTLPRKQKSGTTNMTAKGIAQPSLILYKIDVGPPSCAVMMLCDILGLEYKSKTPDFIKLEHKSPEYKKMNPMGTIPVIIDGDFIISESHAAMKYLLKKYGKEQEERLYPHDLVTQALVDQCMYFEAGVLFLRVKEIVFRTLHEGLKGPTPQNIKDIEDGYSVLEAYLENHKYIVTDHLTLADLSLGATTDALNGFHPLDENKFPRTVEWLTRLNKEPYFNISNHGSKLLLNVCKLQWEKNNV